VGPGRVTVGTNTVAQLPIPKTIDDLLGGLARRRGLPKEIEILLFSVGRHVFRAFGEGAVKPDELVKIYSRLERCHLALAADPSIDPDGSLGADLTNLAAALDATVGASAAPVAPAIPSAPPAPAAGRVPEAPAAPVLAVVHAPIRPEPPRFVARAPALAMPAPAARAPARVAPRPAPPAPPPLDLTPTVVHPFPESAAAEAERDWYWFILEELNGLGGLLAFQRQEGDLAAAARTEQRARATLDTLAWDLAATLRQAWAFAAQRLRDPDDVWGPHLVLFALEPEAGRVRDWRNGLAAEMQAVIEGTPLGTPLEMERGTR